MRNLCGLETHRFLENRESEVEDGKVLDWELFRSFPKGLWVFSHPLTEGVMMLISPFEGAEGGLYLCPASPWGQI